MVVSDHEIDLRNHMEDLEVRLSEYHDQLTDAVRERDELALDAAWGVSQSIVMAISQLSYLAVAGAVWFGLWKYSGAAVWPIVVAVVTFVGLDHFRSPRAWGKVNDERLKEKAQMAKLPSWESKVERFWK